MCLGLPGEVRRVYADDATGLSMAEVAFGPVTQEVCLTLVEAAPGDYVIAHAGFAIARLDEEASAKTLAAFDELVDRHAPR